MITSAERRWLRLRLWLLGIRDYVGTFVLAAGGVLLALGPGDWRFNLGAILAVGAALWNLKNVRRYVHLTEREAQSRQRAADRSSSLLTILDTALRALMDELTDIDFTQARISIYRHRGDHFVPLARVSKSPRLQARGRSEYPENQGAIGRAWDKGAFKATNLPEKRDDWMQNCIDEFGMDESTAATLQMQSRSIVCHRLDTSTPPTSGIGVLVVESLKARGVDGKTLDTLLASPLFPLLSLMLIETIRRLDDEDVDAFTLVRDGAVQAAA